jgi:hypothetical protein
MIKYENHATKGYYAYEDPSTCSGTGHGFEQMVTGMATKISIVRIL